MGSFEAGSPPTDELVAQSALFVGQRVNDHGGKLNPLTSVGHVLKSAPE